MWNRPLQRVCRLALGLLLWTAAAPAQQTPRYAFQTLAKFDSEFRSGHAYHQPASALASLGVMGAGTGATQSKYVARRETPVYIAENCTQCMECITACPDTALPNMSHKSRSRHRQRRRSSAYRESMSSRIAR